MYFVNLLQGEVLTFGGGNHVISNNYISLVKGKEKLIELEKCCLCTCLKTKTKLYLNSPRN